jgi:hypothetical protein
MALVIGMAATGALGDGGVSDAAGEAGALAVRYPGVMRVNFPTVLDWRVTPAPGDSLLAIELDPAFGRVLDIQSVFPEPVRAELADSGIRLLFRSAGNRPVPVHVSIEPRRVGRHALRARAGAGAWLSLSVLILP